MSCYFWVSRVLCTWWFAQGEGLCISSILFLPSRVLPWSEAGAPGCCCRHPSDVHSHQQLQARGQLRAALAAQVERYPCFPNLIKQKANIASHTNFNTQPSRAKQGPSGGSCCQVWQRSEPAAPAPLSPHPAVCSRLSALPCCLRAALSCAQCFTHPDPWQPQLLEWVPAPQAAPHP